MKCSSIQRIIGESSVSSFSMETVIFDITGKDMQTFVSNQKYEWEIRKSFPLFTLLSFCTKK